MPIYGYHCKACEHQFDALQKMNDDPLVDCPECSAPELRKQLSAPKFRLKGQGWYETDFKTGDNKRNLHGESGSKSDSGNKDSKSDSKTSSTKKDSKAKSAEA